MTGPARANRLSRRTLLRAAGTGIALPFLDAMVPVFGRAARSAAAVPSKRMVAIHLPLGWMPRYFFPEKAADGSPATVPSSPYLDLLKDHLGQFTVFSGLAHAECGGGHVTGQCFLTGARNPTAATFRNTQSLDQFVAEKVGLETRFPSLTLAVQHGQPHFASSALSISRSGVIVPAEVSPQRLFRSMFVAGTAAEQAATLRRIEAGGSVLDLVGDEATRLEGEIGPADRARLDQYFTSVREVENRVARASEWEKTPKPTIDRKEPADVTEPTHVFEKARLMFDMIRLALETDSTRTVALMIDTAVVPHGTAAKQDTHGLTHHGNEPEKIAQLRSIEELQTKTFAAFLQSLRDVKEQDGTLLDHTQVLCGSSLGDASWHSNSNLPIILAGGGYRHPGHLAFDEKNNEPLANLYVTMLQRLGIEAGSFATSTGSLRGLDA